MNLASILSARTLAFRFAAAVSLIVLVFSPSEARATPISVPNASFESPANPVSTSTNPNAIAGWVFNVEGGSYYGTESVSSYYSSPGAASGNDFAFINNDYPGVTDTITSAASLGTITPLTTYTLTLAVGNRNGSDSSLYNSPGNVSFSLLANGVPFATKTVTNGTVSNGTFEDFTLTFTTPASGGVVGEDLKLQMAALPEEGSAYVPGFDNVTLNALALDPPAVPEPGTLSMATLGMVALAGAMLRRRLATVRCVAVVVLLLAVTFTDGKATPITVPNASFENPTAPTGGDGAPIPGWVFNVQGGNLFGTAPISQSFTAEGAASGKNYAFLFNDVAGATDTITSAASLGTIAPNTSYTLTLAVGNVGGNDSVSNHSPGIVSFSLLANGVVFATETIPNGAVPDATFKDFNLTVTTPSAGSVIGESLGIQLASLPTPGSGYGPAFDNVTLDATTIVAAPEPPTWALLFAGGMSLAWLMRWRGRTNPITVTTGTSQG